MFEPRRRDGVLCVFREETRWLSSGWSGGMSEGAAAYNISVPDGWAKTDLEQYVRTRRLRAGFDHDGPALLTGVSLKHARRARHGPVEVCATAGISNPGALPVEPSGEDSDPTDGSDAVGTVNLVVGARRALADGALANLLAVAVEAKAATMLSETGFPGTTTDAVVVGCDPAAAPVEYTGSATTVGAATRACTRDAVLASLRSRYPDGNYPGSVEAAEHGVRTTLRSEVDSL